MPKGHLKEILSGPVNITAELAFPIAVNHRMNGGGKPFVTLCEIRYQRGMIDLRIPAAYYFDGASIPRLLWIVRGFSPLDRTILAALIHDFLTDNPQILDRVISDAVFVAVLRHSGIGPVRAKLMHVAVRAWSYWREIRTWFKRDPT